MLKISPLERLITPHELDGSQGANRAPMTPLKQIEANNDGAAITAWLNEFNESPQTQRNYRKEAERLLLWSLISQNKPLSSLTREDMSVYQTFLMDPIPHEFWCGPRKPRNTPNWKPFQGPLSDNSRAQALSILNALFNYLVEAGYLAGNPLGLLRRKMKCTPQTKVERFFEQALWRIIVDYIEQLPKTTVRENTYYERIRYLIAFFYLMGPRISELASHTMGSLYHSRGQWWWRVLGKGKKWQSIPVNRAMLHALIRYRRFHKLSDLPTPEEPTPLFMNLSGTRAVSANRIHRMVKALFADVAEQIKEEHPHYATKLFQASAHWLRHTCITHQTDAGIDLRFIQRNARHSSVDTTSLYQHTEDDQWHASMHTHTLFDSTD